MTDDDLIKRVANLCLEELTPSECDVARISYRLALEEAAQIADADATRDGDFIAAAIRALIKETNV